MDSKTSILHSSALGVGDRTKGKEFCGVTRDSTVEFHDAHTDDRCLTQAN